MDKVFLKKNTMGDEFSSPIGCIVMASGQSKRFGANKLITPLHGKLIIEYVLDAALPLNFPYFLTVTRTKEVSELCEGRGLPVLLHSMPNRNQAVALGLSALIKAAEEKGETLKGCMFCQGDQPLLKATSISNMIDAFTADPKCIYKLSKDGQAGSPVIFPSEFFDQLLCLEEKNGGSAIIRKNPDRVRLVPAQDMYELFDIDTGEDYDKVSEVLKEFAHLL